MNKKPINNTLEFKAQYITPKSAKEFITRMHRLHSLVDATVEQNTKEKTLLVVAEAKPGKKLKACRSILLLSKELNIFVKGHVTSLARAIVFNQLRYARTKAEKNKIQAKQVEKLSRESFEARKQKTVKQVPVVQKVAVVKAKEAQRAVETKLTLKQRLVALFTGRI